MGVSAPAGDRLEPVEAIDDLVEPRLEAGLIVALVLIGACLAGGLARLDER